MQDCRKAVWSIPYVSVACCPSLKRNFIAYHSSKVSDCIFEIHQQWQSDFSKVYSNCCCSSSFEPEIIKIGQSSYKMYSNNILNFQESTPILNAHTKKACKLIVCSSYIYIYIYIYISRKGYVQGGLTLIIMRVLHTSVSWWLFTENSVTASLFNSPVLFSVFWPI